MLFILGVISFLQMAFMPGFIVLKYFRVPLESKLQAFVYCFGSSLLINYLLVYLLTAAGIYKPVTVYIIIVIELIFLAYYWRTSGEKQLSLTIKTHIDSFRRFSGSNALHYNFLFILSILFIGVFFFFFISRFTAVFTLNDAVLGWNRFALDWFHNQIPVNTWYYPQLIPANWSLAYMIMQNPDIQFAARNIMPLFSIALMFLFLDLGLRKKNASYFLALTFFGIIILYLYPPTYIVGGLTDIPAAFFSFLSFYVLHRVEQGSPSSRFNLTPPILSIIFASTAAVTKQPGLYILIIILGWNVRLISRNRTSIPGKTIMKTTAIFFLIIILIVFSWYGYRLVLINKGMERSGIQAVTQDVHEGRTYLERLDYGFSRIVHARDRKDFAVSWIYLALFFLFCSIFFKQSRPVTLFIVIPYTLIWGLFFSYDYRNLTMVFPFMAFAMAMGSRLFAGKLFGLLQKPPAFHFSKMVAAGGIILLLIVLNFTIMKNDRIIKDQSAQQHRVGLLLLNLELYKYHRENGFKGKVFSKYPYFRFLPVLRDYWAPERDAPGVYYYLENFNRTDKELLRKIKRKLRNGKYKLLFTHHEYRFIQVRNVKKSEQTK